VVAKLKNLCPDILTLWMVLSVPGGAQTPELAHTELKTLQWWLRRMYACIYCHNWVALVYMSIALQCSCSTGVGIGLFGRSPGCFGCSTLGRMPLFVLCAAAWKPHGAICRTLFLCFVFSSVLFAINIALLKLYIAPELGFCSSDLALLLIWWLIRVQ